MSDLVNIRSEDNPFFINVADVTAVIEHKDREDKTLALYDEKQGQFFRAGVNGWGFDVPTILKAFENNGQELFSIPLFWGSEEQVGSYHIDPKAVQSIIVSGEKDNSQGVSCVGLLADVKGFGRVETTNVPADLVKKLVKSVEAVNNSLMRIDAKTAPSRWYGDDGYTIFDTSEIRSIHPNGWDMDIKFKDDMRIDFHLNADKKVSQATNEYLNRLVKRIQSDGTREELLAKLGGSLNNLMPRLSRYEERFRKKLRAEFAASVAKENADLVQIQNSKDVYYTALEGISHMRTHKETLSVCFNKTSDQISGPDMHVYFDDNATAQKEMLRLSALINAPKA